MDAHSQAVPSSAHPLIELVAVDFGYDPEEQILESFDFSMPAGEFVAVLGPSGCGKTTVLNLVAGFRSAWRGSVVFDGRDIDGINTNVGYMTQSDTLLPWKTVEANIGLPLEFRRRPTAEIAERVDAMLRLLGMEDKRSSFPAELSGGMKRRVLLARTLIYEPRLLLMDEPFAALDAQLRERLQQELLNLVSELHQSVLFITHDIAESCLLADRIVVVGDKPLRIKHEVQSPFGKARKLEAIVADPKFFAMQRDLRAALES